MSERARVLVVDDDEQITSFLCRALTYAGFNVDVATNGRAGLEWARAQPPDVAVLDPMMPPACGGRQSDPASPGEGSVLLVRRVNVGMQIDKQGKRVIACSTEWSVDRWYAIRLKSIALSFRTE